MVSMTTVFASSKPSNVQPLNHRQSTRPSSAKAPSSILRTLDLPAPQSPCTPIVTGASGVLRMRLTVNRRHGMTPPRSMMSVAYRADRASGPHADLHLS